jgi:hypothetical protein
VVDLDELFWVAGAVKFVDRSRLELVGPGDLLELRCQNVERALPDGVAAGTGERHGGDGDLALRRLMSSTTLRRSS